MSDELPAKKASNAQRFREAYQFFVTEDAKPDLLAVAQRFSLHPSAVVEQYAASSWEKHRSLYQASRMAGNSNTRIQTALRVDNKACQAVERVFFRAADEYIKLAENVAKLPDEPDAVWMAQNQEESRRTQERARFARRKIDLMNDLTEGLMAMVARAADVGFVVAANSRKNAKAEAEREIDFSKLAAIQININGAKAANMKDGMTAFEDLPSAKAD